ncbi:hypothetical protein [Pseudactinotalea sp. Z1748]|uniref:hypothetical protein n=1 Tax=Pseudactinotalea sp. Z1748 TaxID=3413027 RepID=UPI003C7C8FA8
MTTPTVTARQQRLDELLTARDSLNTRIYAMTRRELPRPTDWQQQAHANRADLADLMRILGTRHITHPRPRRGQR